MAAASTVGALPCRAGSGAPDYAVGAIRARQPGARQPGNAVPGGGRSSWEFTWGRGPSLLVTILGVLAFDYFLIPPYMTWRSAISEYLLTFWLSWWSAWWSGPAARLREAGRGRASREAQTARSSLGRDLTSCYRPAPGDRIIIAHIHQAFGGRIAIFMPDNGHLRLLGSTPATPWIPTSWGSPLGFRSTTSLPDLVQTPPAVSLRRQPLTRDGLVGVLGVRLKEKAGLLSPEQREFFNAFCHQAAWRWNVRAWPSRHTRHSLEATEKLQTALVDLHLARFAYTPGEHRPAPAACVLNHPISIRKTGRTSSTPPMEKQSA